MAPSTPISRLTPTFKEEDPRKALIRTQITEGLKHFRKARDQRSGEPRTKSNYRNAFERLQRSAPRTLEPHGPDPRGPTGSEIVFVEAPYPPCASPLADLKPVLLSELTLNSHHRGKVLLTKLIGIVDMTWKNSLAAIEDVSGDVEFLDLHFVCMNKKPAPTWPKLGSWLAIKEPFFTLEEIFTTESIRVDHPSDLVHAEAWPPSFLEQFDLGKALSEKSERSPLQWKQAGNSALAARDFNAAQTSYTQGIHAVAMNPDSSGKTTEKDLYCNRSHVRLTLGRYEGAVTDAVAALTHLSDDQHKKLDAKACFRAALASYSLKHYEKAVAFLGDQLELCPGDKDGALLLKRTEDRLREQHDGCYDIANIQKSLPWEPRVDAADFIINTTIKSSGAERGRGLFATRNIQPGDLIMAETSFCCVWRREDANLSALECNASTPNEAHPSYVGLWRSAVNEVDKNPLRGADLMQLHGNYKGIGTQVNEVDGVAVVDAFQVHDIVACNSFALSPIDQTDLSNYERLVEGSSAMWIRLSYANHSCIPNSQKTTYGDLMLLHATRPIAEGEEITVSYLGDCKNFEARKKKMRVNWGFQCECPLCKADAQCPPANLSARVRLYKEVSDQFTATPPWRKNLSMAPQFERYVEDINRTYSGSLYDDLPKIPLLLAQAWLLEAYTAAQDLPRSRQATVDILHTLGFEVDTDGKSIQEIAFTTESMLPTDAMFLLKPLVGQAIEARQSGAEHVAAQLLNFAQIVELVNYGTNTHTLKASQHHLSKVLGVPEAVIAERMAEMSL